MTHGYDSEQHPQLRRDGTLRTPASDLERRRRFLRLAAGAGFLGLGANGLASAVQTGGQTGSGGRKTTICTTTETYTDSTSSSASFPSGPSTSFSGTEACWGSGGGVTWEGPNSWSYAGAFWGASSNSDYSGEYTQSVAKPGTSTVMESDCVDGTRSYTYSYPSYSSYTSQYSSTESGTRTVTCQGSSFQPPVERASKRFAGFPATLDGERDVLHFPASVAKARERYLRVFGSYPAIP